jgi:hypothetical protein
MTRRKGELGACRGLQLEARIAALSEERALLVPVIGEA